MSKYQQFDEVPVWQEAARLYHRVLDLFEEPNVTLSPNFRNQLDRAALSILNNVAAGYYCPGSEALSMLSLARGSAADVQSMMAVISQRPKLARFGENFSAIRALAESCARQLAGWMNAIQNPGAGARHAPANTQSPPRSAAARPAPGTASQSRTA